MKAINVIFVLIFGILTYKGAIKPLWQIISYDRFDATITGCRDSGWKFNKRISLYSPIASTPKGGTIFGYVFDPIELCNAQIGRQVPVLIDPKNPTDGAMLTLPQFLLMPLLFALFAPIALPVCWNTLRNNPVKSPASDKIIYSDSKENVWLSWRIAIVVVCFLGIIFTLGHHSIMKLFGDKSPWAAIFLILAFSGLYSIYVAFRKTMKLLKYGRARLTLYTIPATLGKNIGGEVLIATIISQPIPAKVTLTCYHELTKAALGEKNQRIKPLWKDTLRVAVRPNAPETRIAFNFKPPVHLPASSQQDEENHIWKIQVTLPLSGDELEQTFVIPVVK